MSNHNIQLVRDNFHGREIPRVYLPSRDQWFWPARHVGRAIEQGDDGKQFVRNVTEGDGVEGVDYIRVSADELASVRAELNKGGNSPLMDSRGHAMVLLTESGLNLGLMSSRTELGKAMRLWLAREVLPSIRATGRYESPSALSHLVAIMRELLAPMQQQMSTVEQRMAALETRSHAGPSGTMGSSLATQIRRRLRSIADCYEPRATPKWHSQRMKIEHRVMRAADLPKRAWEQQDPSRLHTVLTALEEAERDASVHRGTHSDPQQPPLFGRVDRKN